jgi:hypothetical protein
MEEEESAHAVSELEEEESAHAVADLEEEESANAVADLEEEESADAVADLEEEESAHTVADLEEEESADAVADLEEEESADAVADLYEQESVVLERRCNPFSIECAGFWPLLVCARRHLQEGQALGRNMLTTHHQPRHEHSQLESNWNGMLRQGDLVKHSRPPPLWIRSSL